MAFLKKVFLTTGLVFSFVFSTWAQAHPSPSELLSSVGQKLFAQIAELDSDNEQQKRENLKQLVNAQLFPHVDLKFVSFKLLGKHIRTVNRNDVPKFVNAVKANLVSTYANALMAYKGQKVVFAQSSEPTESKYATVKARIIEAGAPEIDLQFKLRKNKQGEWKVYDMVAEGISLLSAKQKEVVRRISDVGLDKVIVQLEKS
ncbi:MlaC/ttg2D family ABC transporter substrate-binding protein [Catenovulum adriaticum]|uniref:ABC transporter substrate-binding protein n=1 Tax=Catenovulum adriaticum TaxID=2984846 RepID=A0ABY7ANU0_9ALTE|nr:ABC transporter substrate-binding protein [Catenovulum sp. TS8]WAJ70321.1 ABC transporter substrate-binding protein [Catenovulum sp. TS8]